jgi:hypothetical protein
MIRRGVGLPIVLVVTLVIAAVGLWAAAELRGAREQRMVQAAGEDLAAMMDAVDRYRALYTKLPRRLSELNKVGYRESGGMIVCTFDYNEGGTSGAAYLNIALKHRAAERGAWTQYPNNQRMIKLIAIPDCKSARRSS